ncbi:putative aldouronate transport system permease protein [Paenibacillus sp. UNCCL117]|uniref:carbohydrate ABC transporter permease n=1 Tax=unclassified Paenibacillus TaxID=185978 RepID=UPI00089090CA|nr:MULTISPECIES: carbohydrate ABC transporter permease [unclassified Paenibacillus]SDC27260.1 putative aldouronate transport system permease protein [Paenibacillus sp. cl123]SFW20296.1 putative aldouronate transport system permease protein [Paenibacillus sp. UNCCL117]
MRVTPGERLFYLLNHVFLLFIGFLAAFPFWNIFVVSFNEGRDAMQGSIYFWPRKFSLEAYIAIFNESSLMHATYISIARTVSGTLLGLIGSAILAYLLSNRELVFRRGILFFFIFTMYFSGGLIPEFMLIKNLHLYNNFLVYIIPGAISVWNVMVMRQFFEELPPSLAESARIDGASELSTLKNIILPMSTPVLATIALMIGVAQWTTWFDTYMFTSGSKDLATLQGVLVNILMETQIQSTDPMQAARLEQAGSILTPEIIKMATITITTVPIIMIYPFLQKYFVGGLTVGAVKE